MIFIIKFFFVASLSSYSLFNTKSISHKIVYKLPHFNKAISQCMYAPPVYDKWQRWLLLSVCVVVVALHIHIHSTQSIMTLKLTTTLFIIYYKYNNIIKRANTLIYSYEHTLYQRRFINFCIFIIYLSLCLLVAAS